MDDNYPDQFHHVPLRGFPANQRLTDRTHPLERPNPPAGPTRPYDLVVVGGGTGGLVSAGIVGALGGRVALIEERFLGGDCLVYGCVPSKALLAAAAEAKRGAGPDFSEAMARLREARSTIAEHDAVGRIESYGVDVFLGRARFLDPHRVRIKDEVVHFSRAILATGSSPILPPIEGLSSIDPLTNETLFAIDELPESVVVLGAGPIGCEMAQALARFGAEVHLVERKGRVLSRDDEDAAGLVRRALVTDGVTTHLGHELTRVVAGTRGEPHEFRLRAEDGTERVVRARAALVAVGRSPTVDGLDLERTGVEFDPRRGIATDERLRTSQPHIWAVGDVALARRFTHAADATARMVVRNAFFFGRRSVHDLIVPWCTYTSPELAGVGATREAAARAGLRVDTYEASFADNDRAVCERETTGFARILCERGGDRIVGATIVGRDAGEIIGQISLAMKANIGLGELGEVIYPYPTRAEIVRTLADQYTESRLTELAKRATSSLFGAQRALDKVRGRGP